MAEEVSQQLLECEAITLLRKGYNTADRLSELTALIAKKRGAALLVEEMRSQWRTRAEWLI
ncbi:hypothetical protein PtoMrB4_37050 [Metapseudomonas otitidis]|uniref:Uncharacterized protein n=1 Tax=Metapseudomonas otitidis TaxID=319939 RepID=A0A679GMY4_9GAMM|nr:hypothetical protein PtoMrB4_37050 [Pseudomonas otitidis]